MDPETGLTLKERLADLERVVVDFEKKLQLDKIRVEEIDLEVNRENLVKMTSEDIYIMCMEWAYYSLGVQKEINVATSRYYWAESVLNRYLAEQSQNYKGFTYNERCMYVLAADSYAQSVNTFKEKCKLIMDRNQFITSKIDFLTKLAQNVAFSRRGEKNE